jgi:acetoin:2,6-dichlorophenolindophenol oxidoreductase subunit beta
VIFARELGETLRQLLAKDPRVLVLGEDVLDPYGGAFKVTRGLSSEFPSRVKTMPVSEGAIAGLSAGLALAGYRPITEIMFGDFMALCFDQIVNHISKYQAMYAGGATCPVIMRTPSGGGRGYGPTHSQSLEKHFLGVPNLKIAAASLFHRPLEVFERFLAADDPVLYFEHKLLYPQNMILPDPKTSRIGAWTCVQEASEGALPTVCSTLVTRASCSFTVLAYGYQALLAMRVMEKLAMEEELFGELVVPAQIAPIDFAPIERSVRATKSLISVEEGTAGWSWGTEIAASLQRRLFGALRRPIEVLASERTVIPGSRTEEARMLVGPDKIERAIREAAT